jgi:hypothetical protein
VYTTSEGGFAQTAVKIGRASEMEVEIVSGLDEGEGVLLRRPTTGEIVSEIEVKAGESMFGGGRPGGRPSGRPSGKPAGVAAASKPASAGTS